MTTFDGDAILRHVPYMRRYAALLCLGDRDRGDRLVERTLINVTTMPHDLKGQSSDRLVLFRAMQQAVRDDPFAVPEPILGVDAPDRSSPPTSDHSDTDDGVIGGALGLLAEMPVEQRGALLLVTIEGLSHIEAADILGTNPSMIEALFADAREGLEKSSLPLSRMA